MKHIFVIVKIIPKELFRSQKSASRERVKHRTKKTFGDVEGKLHAFLTSPSDGSEWSALRLGRFAPEGRTACWLSKPHSSPAAKRDLLVGPGRGLGATLLQAEARESARLLHYGNCKHGMCGLNN
jgi:hypothetical protein